MQRVGIITDTTAQLTPEVIEKYGVTVVPTATIHCNGKAFVDGIDITPAQAYEMLAQNPTEFRTAAISADYFIKAYLEMGKRFGEVICITISSNLSAEHQSAVLAIDLIKDAAPGLDVKVFDSLNVAGGEGLIALATAKAAFRGLGIEEVTGVAEKARENVECFFVFNTTKHIYRSGRVPKMASQVGSALGVKPICRIGRDGKVHFIGVARSRNKGLERMLASAMEVAGERPVNVMVIHSAAVEEAEALKGRVESEFNCVELLVSEFSPVMGYAIGPGLLGMAFYPQEVEAIN